MTAAPTLAEARAALVAQPFSRLLGTRITEFGPEGVCLELEVTDDLRQQDGLVHGGVLAYLVDNGVTFAAGAVLGPGLVTAGIAVEFVASARAGVLAAGASVLAHGTSQATVRCDVTEVSEDGTQRLCATGQGRVVTRRS